MEGESVEEVIVDHEDPGPHLDQFLMIHKEDGKLSVILNEGFVVFFVVLCVVLLLFGFVLGRWREKKARDSLRRGVGHKKKNSGKVRRAGERTDQGNAQNAHPNRNHNNLNPSSSMCGDLDPVGCLRGPLASLPLALGLLPTPPISSMLESAKQLHPSPATLQHLALQRQNLIPSFGTGRRRGGNGSGSGLCGGAIAQEIQTIRVAPIRQPRGPLLDEGKIGFGAGYRARRKG